MTPLDDPLMRTFRQALESAYGDRLRGVLLYGSRARGDHRPDSDYDVAVFLDHVDDWYREVEHLVDISFASVGEEAAALISARAFSQDALDRRTPLMAQIRQDGIAL